MATGRGRVVQLREGQSHRLCGYEATSQSIALSRALGDACEAGWVLLGGGRASCAAGWACKLGTSASWADSWACLLEVLLPCTVLAPQPANHASCLPPACLAGATELGLTFEPDALSITLPNPADWPGSSSGGSGGSTGEQAAPRPARHVLVVASDGLWDMLTNEEAVGIALRCEGNFG